jgi:hypothetical protein
MAPQDEWTPRSDASTRKVIDRLDRLTEEVEAFEGKLTERLKGHVTYAGLWGSAIALLGLVATLVFALNAPVKESAAATRLEMKDARKDLGVEVRELRKEFREEIRSVAAEVKAPRTVTVDGAPRSEAKAELKRSQSDK